MTSLANDLNGEQFVECGVDDGQIIDGEAVSEQEGAEKPPAATRWGLPKLLSPVVKLPAPTREKVGTTKCEIPKLPSKVCQRTGNWDAQRCRVLPRAQF